MKPRSKREREVVELSSKLPLISDKQKEWAKENVFPHEVYRSADWCWCSDCGHAWIATDEDLACNNGYIECPYCHKKLKAVVSRKKKSYDADYMTIATTIKGYQVLRHVYCQRYSYNSEKYQIEDNVYYEFTEVVQEWIDLKGKRTIIALAVNLGGGWLLNSDLSIKVERIFYGKNYAIFGYIYPIVRLLSELKKRGLSKKALDKATPSRLIECLLQGGNDYELCIKTKQYSMLKYMSRKGFYQLRYKPSFNICNRNHYIIKNADMWEDYIDLLVYFNKDIRNAKFVCPKNLKKEHDVLMLRKQKKEAEIRRQREHEQAVKKALERKSDILNFYKTHSKFFGIEIAGNGITIHPLESVTQFYKEATVMHHCVFTNRYYSRNDCLILSAKDNAGNRLETIEVSLKTWEVVQSRATHNGMSDKHKDIIKLVEKNINLIKQKAAS